MQGGFLFPRAGVGRCSLGRQSAFVANANRVLVVAYGVGTHQVLVPRLVHLSVAGDVVVVAGEPEACVVPGYHVLHREPTVAPCGRAMDNDEINASHVLFSV